MVGFMYLRVCGFLVSVGLSVCCTFRWCLFVGLSVLFVGIAFLCVLAGIVSV